MLGGELDAVSGLNPFSPLSFNSSSKTDLFRLRELNLFFVS
jgi:hypothetical protein